MERGKGGARHVGLNEREARLSRRSAAKTEAKSRYLERRALSRFHPLIPKSHSLFSVISLCVSETLWQTRTALCFSNAESGLLFSRDVVGIQRRESQGELEIVGAEFVFLQRLWAARGAAERAVAVVEVQRDRVGLD
jgi:hypothetical protein